MDTLTCRSPSRCATCAHFDAAAGCALEADLNVALDALEAPRPRQSSGVLLLVDARRAHA
jgi:hypothetical protein